MDGKNAILADILSVAEKSAANLISDANAEKSAALDALKKELDAKKEVEVKRAEVDGAELLTRRLTLAELEERKTVLFAKQKAIESVYYQTVTKIINMTDHIYRDLIAEILAKYAEDGDRVIVAERDTKRLNAAWLEELSEKLHRHITLSEETHKGRGGVILIGRRYDKNLTFEAILAQLRQETESEVVKKLFKAD